MASPHPYQPPSGQHDTTVLPPLGAGAVTYAQPDGWLPPGATSADPQAEYWAARFRRQRRWTRVLAVLLLLGGMLAAGGAVAVWRVVSGVSSLGAAPESVSVAPPGTADEAVPGLPDAGASDGTTADGSAPDVSDVPLPEQLRGLGSMLGVDNLEEALDAAVANGLLSQEQADQIRMAVRTGQSLAGLGQLLGGAA